jgi:hypothetical protein
MKELAKKWRGIPIGLLGFKAMLCQGSVTTWSLVSFHIEFCFSYNAEDGSNYLDLAWIEGVIESLVNAKQRRVMIRWNEEKVAEGDLLVSKHRLSKRHWNPKNAQENAWREYIGSLKD